jgi:hypothetical protein
MGDTNLVPTFWTVHFNRLTSIQKFLRLLLLLVVLPSLVSILVLLASNMTLRTLPKMGAIWIVYSIPVVTSGFAWINFCQRYGVEHDRIPVMFAMGTTTVPILVAVGQASYVQFIGDLTFETWMAIVAYMLLFSFVAFLAALLIIARSPRWFSVLTLFAATWMLVLSVLFGMAT